MMTSVQQTQCIANRLSEKVVAKAQSQMNKAQSQMTEYYKKEIEVMKKKQLETRNSANELKHLQQMIIVRANMANTDKKGAAKMELQILALSTGRPRRDTPTPMKLQQMLNDRAKNKKVIPMSSPDFKIDEGNECDDDENESDYDDTSSDDEESGSGSDRSTPNYLKPTASFSYTGTSAAHVNYSSEPISSDADEDATVISEKLVKKTNEMKTRRYKELKHMQVCKENELLLHSQLEDKQRLLNSVEMETESLQGELKKLYESLSKKNHQMIDLKKNIQELTVALEQLRQEEE